MKQYKAQISKIDTFSTVDGPGIRTTIFFNKCKLRCKFCHNPETWKCTKPNYTVEELVKKILRSKPYFQDNGGVTLSGGEPLLHDEFIIELCKRLKKENIHITLDTSGIGNGNYKEILKHIDLVILDVKNINSNGFKQITQTDNYEQFLKFIEELNMSNKSVWIRQVIIPNVNDNYEYVDKLSSFIHKYVKNVKRIEFLPFHTLGFNKYTSLNIKNPYKDKQALDNKECQKMFNYFNKKYKNVIN